MELVEITKQEAQEQKQVFVFNPLINHWSVEWGEDKSFFRHAYEKLKYYKVVEEK